MRIVVLSVPGCPNLEAFERNLAEAVAERADIAVEHRVVVDAADARRCGMRGSPTVLIDGADPFAAPGMATSMGCRVYRDESGAAGPCPSVAQLRAAVARIGEDAASGCCDDPGEPGSMVRALLGGGSCRSAPVERGMRALQVVVLRAFATTGAPPRAGELDLIASRSGTTAAAALAALHEQDFLRLDEHGAIRVAYPFSATPTRHRVALAGGGEVFAMCAIDALGIPVMLGADAVVTAASPVEGEVVQVEFRGGNTRWSPETAVVFVGTSAGGPAADVCCGYVNFFPTWEAARGWSRDHAGVDGTVLNQDEAETLGRNIFGELLAG